MITADRVTEKVQLSSEEQERQQLLEKLQKVQSRLRAQVEKRYPGHRLRQDTDQSEWVKVIVIRPGDQDRENASEIKYLMRGRLYNKKAVVGVEVFVTPDGTAFPGDYVVYSSGGDYGRRVFVQPSSLPDGKGKTELFANGLSVLSDPEKGIGTGETFHLKVALLSIRGYFSKGDIADTLNDQEVCDALDYFEEATPIDPANPDWRQRVKKAFTINL